MIQMILITALLPIDWFTYCYGSAFFKWKESRFTIGNVHRSDLQWQMKIVGIVSIYSNHDINYTPPYGL